MRRRFLSIAALSMLVAASVLVPVAFADDDGDDNGGGGPPLTQCPPSLTSVNHVQNGSFESLPESAPFRPLVSGDPGIPPWTVSGDGLAPVDHVGTYWQAAHLVHSIDMEGTNGRGILTQNVATAAGQQYHLCFAYAANPDNCPRADDQMQVKWNGVVVATVTVNCAGRTHASMGWEYTGVTVTGTGPAVLQFESLTTGSWGVALDDVSLVSQGDDDDDGDDDDGGDDDDDDGGGDDDDDGDDGRGGILP